MQKLLNLLVLLLIFISCSEKNNSDLNYLEGESDSILMESVKSDSTKILMANFPFAFDSTNVLIHTVSILTNEKDKGIRSLIPKKHAAYGESIGDILYDTKYDCVNGNIINIYFEDIDNNIQQNLTDKALLITDFNYLRELGKNKNRHYLLYTVYDKDYNKDGNIDRNDIPSLYISELNGSKFTKLTDDLHYYKDGMLRIQVSRFYFRTIEDSNQDGIFNKNDKLHYYYLALDSDNPFNAIEYYPLGK